MAVLIANCEVLLMAEFLFNLLKLNEHLNLAEQSLFLFFFCLLRRFLTTILKFIAVKKKLKQTHQTAPKKTIEVVPKSKCSVIKFV